MVPSRARLVAALGAMVVLAVVVGVLVAPLLPRLVAPDRALDPASSPLVPVPSPVPGGAVLVGSGDIASCETDGDEATARLVEALLGPEGIAFTTGDNAYPNGTTDEYARCYEPTWGRFKARTRPVPGNHEYRTFRAQGYFDYFGPSVGSYGASWYTFRTGGWTIHALDSNCADAGGCGPGSPQHTWLRDALAADTGSCVAAIWHHPRWGSGRHGDAEAVGPLWELLHAAGAELVLTGHEHYYERFVPLDPRGRPDLERGLRQIIVGTGGRSHYGFERVHAGSEVRHSGAYGVLRLTLLPGRYEWRFVALGSPFSDAGSAPCHDAPPAPVGDAPAGLAARP